MLEITISRKGMTGGKEVKREMFHIENARGSTGDRELAQPQRFAFVTMRAFPTGHRVPPDMVNAEI